MTTKTYTIESFAREFDIDAKLHAERVFTNYKRAMHREARDKAEAITPTDTGDMVGRWGDRLGRRDTVPSSPGAAEKRIKFKTRHAVINDDPGAAAIDHGRKRNHYKNFSRMGGSPQAPRGVSKPTVEHVLNRSEQIGAEAIAKAERRYGR